MRQAGWTATPARTEPARGANPTHRAVDESRVGAVKPRTQPRPRHRNECGRGRRGRAGAATTQVGAVGHGVREPIPTTTGSLWTGGDFSSERTPTHESAPSMRRGGPILVQAASLRPVLPCQGGAKGWGPSLCECDRSSAILRSRIPLPPRPPFGAIGPREAAGDGTGGAGRSSGKRRGVTPLSWYDWRTPPRLWGVAGSAAFFGARVGPNCG